MIILLWLKPWYSYTNTILRMMMKYQMSVRLC